MSETVMDSHHQLVATTLLHGSRDKSRPSPPCSLSKSKTPGQSLSYGLHGAAQPQGEGRERVAGGGLQ